ncbi:MAG: FkbM family methyltransferase [Saprospiraceae bacterium]|nr:FkbM family methyltransferase [Saprospiraceae bacterium]
MVETITIEDLLKSQNIAKIDFIKIDIEGYEYFAFDGSKSTLLDQNAPDILFEFVDWAEDLAGVDKGVAQNFLRECGYQLYKLHESRALTPLDTILTKGDAVLFASKGPVSIKKQGP